MPENNINRTPKEVDVFNRFSKFNKLKAILIVVIASIVSIIALYFFAKSLMSYTITIVPNGGLVYGKEVEVQSYRFLQKTSAPAGFKNEGYYIEGYYKNKEMTERFEFGKAIWNSVKLYVNWQPGFAVQLRFADGEEGKSNYSLEQLKTYHEQYVKPGSKYTLHKVYNDIPYLSQEGVANHEGEQLLWYKNADCSGMPIEIDTFKLDKDIVLYGKWFDTSEDKFQVSEDGVLIKYLGNCRNLILPSSVKKIKNIDPSQFVDGAANDANTIKNLSVFQNVMKELEIVFINEQCDDIGDCAFKACNNLKEVKFLGNKVTRIGDHAFWCCSSLKSIDIPSSVTTIGERAFYSASKLQSLSGGDNITQIKNYAFMETALKQVRFSKVVKIGKGAFSNIMNLEKVVLGCAGVVDSTEVTATSGSDNNNVLYLSTSAKVYVPDNLVSSYKSTYPWNSYADRIYGISTLD